MKPFPQKPRNHQRELPNHRDICLGSQMDPAWAWQVWMVPPPLCTCWALLCFTTKVLLKQDWFASNDVQKQFGSFTVQSPSWLSTRGGEKVSMLSSFSSWGVGSITILSLPKQNESTWDCDLMSRWFLVLPVWIYIKASHSESGCGSVNPRSSSSPQGTDLFNLHWLCLKTGAFDLENSYGNPPWPHPKDTSMNAMLDYP